MNMIKTMAGLKWGYWAGAGFCTLALLSLALGFAPLLTAARQKLKLIEIPGEMKLDFKIPGSYIGVYFVQAQQPNIEDRLRELEYSLIDDEANELLNIDKIPKAAYASDTSKAGKEQIPLFQFVIDKVGSYTLISHYPYEMEGPKAQVVIFAMDFSYTRREVIVGIIVFLIFLILGIYTLRKTYKATSDQ